MAERETFSPVPPLFRSTRGLAAYYALVLPIVAVAVYGMVRGGAWMQTSLYLIVGLVAALSLSYTVWLAREITDVSAWRARWRRRVRSRESSTEVPPSGPLSLEDSN